MFVVYPDMFPILRNGKREQRFLVFADDFAAGDGAMGFGTGIKVNLAALAFEDDRAIDRCPVFEFDHLLGFKRRIPLDSYPGKLAARKEGLLPAEDKGLKKIGPICLERADNPGFIF